MKINIENINIEKIKTIIIVVIVTFASVLVPKLIYHLSWPHVSKLFNTINSDNYYYFLFLLFSLALIIKDPKNYGFRIGKIKKYFKSVLFVCGLPILLTITVYPFTSKPFSGAPFGIWLISPLAQDILFMGYIYKKLETSFSGNLRILTPVNVCLIIGAFIYAGWHIPNFTNTKVSFVIFQLFFTFCAYIFTGLSRQWTGSFLYVTIFHMSSNFFACYI